MRGLQPDQKMNAVSDAADSLRKSIQSFDRTTEVFVQTF